MIKINSLVCGYHKKDVLTDLNLCLGSGETAGILGPNGSGKSTLLSAVAGILPYRSGNIRVEGKEIAAVPPRDRARLIASVPQRSELSFPFKCLSIVLMGRYPYLSRFGSYSKQDMEKALSAMEQTGTVHLAHRLITHVSGGEAQRVIIARALAQESKILLLDEAASGLDAAVKIELFDLLLKKNATGTTLLCVMHDLNLAALYCNRLIFLKNGRIVSDGPTQKTFNESNLSTIYNADIRVSKHPVTGTPQAHFVPGRSGRPRPFDHGPGP